MFGAWCVIRIIGGGFSLCLWYVLEHISVKTFSVTGAPGRRSTGGLCCLNPWHLDQMLGCCVDGLQRGRRENLKVVVRDLDFILVYLVDSLTNIY